MMRAEQILDAIENWARGMVVVREFEGINPCTGRLDAVLVPVSSSAHCMKARIDPNGLQTVWFWARPCIIGVEVKVTRTDFLRGLRNGQYDRYQANLSALYVATPLEVCKTPELPAGVGRLLIKETHGAVRVACKRHPTYRQVVYDSTVPWRLMFRIHHQYLRKLRAERRRRV